MKIRPSLRIYFLVSLLIVGSVTITAFSVLSANYFISGLKIATRLSMLDATEAVGVEDGKPVKGITLTIASRWQDIPEQIREKFQHEPDTLYKLNARVEDKVFLSRPKSAVFVIKTMNKKGEIRFLAKEVFSEDFEYMDDVNQSHHIQLLFFGATGLLVFGVVIFFLIRKIADPIERLKSWTKDLNKENLKNPPPDFNYAELNTLASLAQSSLLSVQESLDREQQFLSYASHELRTPIAVTRTNSELLNKLIKAQKNPEKQQEVVERIHRASITMTDLTETLLWLTRSEGKSLPQEQVNLGSLVEQLTYELDYLRIGKKVEVEISTDGQDFELPAMLCRIVIANLIRNAFQHTAEGMVSIEQKGRSIQIVNQNSKGQESREELGFGLGLQLTEKLIRQYRWQYKSSDIEGGRSVSLTL